jgi:hypothetical protein
MKEVYKFECPHCGFIEWLEIWEGVRGYKRCVMCHKLTLPYQIFIIEEDDDDAGRMARR